MKLKKSYVFIYFLFFVVSVLMSSTKFSANVEKIRSLLFLSIRLSNFDPSNHSLFHRISRELATTTENFTKQVFNQLYFFFLVVLFSYSDFNVFSSLFLF